MRLGNLLLVVILLVLLVIIVDPGARQKATALINKWNHEVAVNPPSISVNNSGTDDTPVPTVTPLPTPLASDDNEVIPNTGGSDETNERPIIQVNWDALNAALRRFWDSLRNIKINLNPATNR